MSSMPWIGAYLVLCWLLQMVLELTNQQFLLLFALGAALIFIVTSFTHTHDIDAEETVLKAVDKLDASLEKIISSERSGSVIEAPLGPSGHKAPKGF